MADQESIMSVRSVQPSPDTLTKLVARLRLLTLTLLPLEADPESINDPTSRIITPSVISAFVAASGDFVEALPYCLLRARRDFMIEANRNPADYGENYGRAIACEVLARRVVHQAPPDRLTSIMSTRFRHREWDGDDSDLSTALELAIDSQCTIFLSSSEAQDVINDIWAGVLVQKNNANNDIDYVPYDDTRSPSFWGHFDPSRLSVPRYQNFFRIIVWLFFLITYSLAVREPLEKLSPSHQALDEWEVVLYVMTLAFSFEDFHKIYKLLHFATWRSFTFWNLVSFTTDSLLITAFILRLVGLTTTGPYSDSMRLKSFQVLSFVSPLIWMKLITIFDGYKYVGTMQICIARMLRESGIFFGLLSLLGIGFAQGLYALDAADGETESAFAVINVLVQALLQAPDYAKFSSSPAGLTLYYLWNIVTAVILLNILISLFSSAYSEVVDDAAAEFLRFFAEKTVSMIRAPDEFVYPAPFNLIELLLVAPLELVLDRKTYARLNRFVMSTIFAIPMIFIALHESLLDPRRNKWMNNWVNGTSFDDNANTRDPEVDGEDADRGLKISTVPFSELLQAFPNTTQSSEATILKELDDLKRKMDTLAKLLEARS